MIANLTKEKIAKLWPKRTNKVYVLNHIKNEAHSIRRMVESALQIKNLEKVCLLLDDSTTDYTEWELRRLQHDYPGKVLYKKFFWENNFGLAKNQAMTYAMECGMKKGDWAFVLGGDFSFPMKSAWNIDKLTSNSLAVISRHDVPEYDPDPSVITKTRPRILLWRHRPDIHWEYFQFVHENMYNSFYRLTNMGDYFKKDHDIPTSGQLIHHGQHEDSEEEKEYKRFKYLFLGVATRYVQLYFLTGGYYVVLKKIMKLMARNNKVLSNILKKKRKKKTHVRIIWNEFVEAGTRDWMKNGAPKGCQELFVWMDMQKTSMSDYS